MKCNRIGNADDPTMACMKDIISANSRESNSPKGRKKDVKDVLDRCRVFGLGWHDQLRAELSEVGGRKRTQEMN